MSFLKRKSPIQRLQVKDLMADLMKAEDGGRQRVMQQINKGARSPVDPFYYSQSVSESPSVTLSTSEPGPLDFDDFDYSLVRRRRR